MGWRRKECSPRAEPVLHAIYLNDPDYCAISVYVFPARFGNSWGRRPRHTLTRQTAAAGT
jgi:hypothetical protein